MAQSEPSYRHALDAGTSNFRTNRYHELSAEPDALPLLEEAALTRTIETQLQHHIAIAPEIVEKLTKPIIDGGGKTAEVMTVLETVVLGTISTLAVLDGHDRMERYVEAMVRSLADAVVDRARRIDLIEGPPAGSA